MQNYVVIHQIGSNHEQVLPLLKLFNEDTVNVHSIQLLGHTNDPRDLCLIQSYHQWLNQLREVITSLSGPITFIGLGSSGLLGLLLAQTINFTSLHLINTNLFLSWKQKLILRMLRHPNHLIKSGKQVNEARNANYFFHEAVPEKIFHIIATMKKQIIKHPPPSVPISFHLSLHDVITLHNPKKILVYFPHAKIYMYNSTFHDLLITHATDIVKSIAHEKKLFNLLNSS